MNLLRTRVFNALLKSSFLTVAALMKMTCGHAANSTYDWVGNTNNLTVNTNWDPVATPISGDVGVFGLSGSYTPEVSSGSGFAIDLIHLMDDNAEAYAFNVKDSGSSLTFAGSGISLVSGVQNDSLSEQTFNVFNQGKIVFQGNCSADSAFGSNPGHITYAVGNTDTAGNLIFEDQAIAGQAKIEVNNGNVRFKGNSLADDAVITMATPQSTLHFNDQSGADHATVTASNGNKIVFNDKSGAENGSFDLTNATIRFNDVASADEADINLHDGSTIVFAGGSEAGTAMIHMTETDEMELSQTEESSFYATLTGEGTINKTSSSKVNYLADNKDFKGVTNVLGGDFALNGNLGGTMLIYEEARLSGKGNFFGDVYVAKGGSVAPGNSIADLFIHGNYIQAPDSTLIIQMDGAGLASKVWVSNQTSLNMGSGLLAVPLVMQLAPNQTFTSAVLISNEGLSGTFSQVASINPLIAVAVSYDPTHAFMTWTNAFSLMGKTANQRKVTDQLQTLSDPSSEEFAILSALALQSPQRQRHTLDQLTAQPYANLLLSAEFANHKFIRRLYNPLRLLVTSHPCCSLDASCEQGCMVDTWLDTGWNRSNFRGNRNARGFSLKGVEVSLGSQMTVDHCWTFGLAASYERDHINYKVGGHGTSNTYLGALYALYRPSDFYVLGDVVGGYTQTKLRRNIDIRSLRFSNRGKPDIYQGTFYVEAGQDFGIDCFLFQPFVGLEAGIFRHDQIHEKGNNFFAVDVRRQTYGTASSRLGMHFLTEFSCFKLFVDGAWQYRLTSLHNRSHERFQDFGSDFRIRGIPFAHSSFDGALNLSATLFDGWEVYTEAQGQWWKNASTFTILGGLAIAW